MTREEFLSEYILSRTSHKRNIQDLVHDASYAWEAIQPEQRHGQASTT
jgi:hypothetical protein